MSQLKYLVILAHCRKKIESTIMRLPSWGLLLLSLFFIGNSALYAQSNATPNSAPTGDKVNKKVQKAYEAYDAEEYFVAIELLKKAFTEVKGRKDKSTVLFKIAESYKYTLDYKNAESYYKKAAKLGYEDPVALLYQGDMLRALGEYEEAIVVYKEFKEIAPSDVRGDVGIESAKMGADMEKNPTRYQVFEMEGINSREMDFSPFFGGKARENNVLIFTSNRDESLGRDEDGWTGQSFMDLYITSSERKKKKRGVKSNDEKVENPAEFKWSTPVLLDEEMVNTKMHEGAGTFNSRKKDMYFTRCMAEENEKLGCGIYMTEMQGQNWKEPKRIYIDNDTNANVGHPSLSADDQYLYFVSTDFNPKGDRDIFVATYSKRENGWGNVRNLGPEVNTAAGEYFPFSHDDGYLYFASNGLPGMGGLDVFRIKMGEDGLPEKGAKAENMGAPINSRFEDFGLIFQPGNDEVGFVTSNRNEKSGDDIYAVVKAPLVFVLEGVLTSSKDATPVGEATVKLEGSDGTSLQVTTDKDGYYVFEEGVLKEDLNYKLFFERKKFLNNQGDATTVGVDITSFEYIPLDNHFIHRVILNKTLDPIDVPIVLPNVFFDLAKWDLRPESKVALDSVVSILNNNPTIVIEMRSHTDYRDSDEKNKALSQKRAASTVDYLIEKGIDKERLEARGMGESEPFVIPEGYIGYGKEVLKPGAILTESYIKAMRKPEDQEVANQVNRRTDFKVLRDDYVPSSGLVVPEGVDPKDIINKKATEEKPAGEIYVIQNRESLGVIAKKFDISIVDLKRINGGLRGVRPFEGMEIKVDKDGDYSKWDEEHYLVKRRGEKMKDIAMQNGMKTKELEALNPDIKDADLLPGRYIKIK